MYFVAFCDNWCSVVPKSWVDNKTSLISWPPKNENPTTVCKKGISPKSNWNHVKFSKLLGPYSNHNIARQVEIAAVDLSTCDEGSFTTVEKEKTVLPKRQRKLPARFQKTSDESSEDNENDGNSSSESQVPDHNFDYLLPKNIVAFDDLETQPLQYEDFCDDPAYDKLKEQEKNKKSSKNYKSPELPDTGAEVLVEEKSDENGANGNNHGRTHKEVGNLNIDPKNHTTFENGDKGTSQRIVIPPANENCENCCRACRLKLDQMDRKMNTILLYIAESKNSTQVSSMSSFNALPEFTIKNDEALKQFNKTLLHNEEARTQYVKILKITLITLRVKPEGKKHVREVLGYILDNTFSCKLSGSGQKKTISVKEMAFVKILTSAIINCNPRNTITEINQAIKSWLQHANDRVKYSNKKHEALNNQT